ncbi:hypothetical protein OROMI_009220 [Orobanche minor]
MVIGSSDKNPEDGLMEHSPSPSAASPISVADLRGVVSKEGWARFPEAVWNDAAVIASEILKYSPSDVSFLKSPPVSPLAPQLGKDVQPAQASAAPIVDGAYVQSPPLSFAAVLNGKATGNQLLVLVRNRRTRLVGPIFLVSCLQPFSPKRMLNRYPLFLSLHLLVSSPMANLIRLRLGDIFKIRDSVCVKYKF